MSIALTPADLSSAVVGAKGTINLNQVGVGAGGVSANPSLTKNPPHVRLSNSSGCGLYISFRDEGHTDHLDAGYARNYAIAPGESAIDWTVEYLMNVAQPVSILTATYYGPGEPIDETGTLGNSPIGGGVSTVNQSVTSDGLAVGTSVVEATPGGDTVSAVSLLNSGVMQLGSSQRKGLLTVAGALSQIQGDGTNNLILESGGLTKAVEVNVNSSQIAFIDRLGLALNSPGYIRGAAEDLKLDTDSSAHNVILLNNAVQIASILSTGLSIIPSTTVNGSLAGTLVYAFPIWGPGLKVCMITLQGFNGTVVTVNFPSALARSWIWVGGLGGGTGTVQPRLAGVAVNTRIVTAFATTGGTFASALPIHQGSIGDIESSIDNIQVTVGGVSESIIWVVGM